MTVAPDVRGALAIVVPVRARSVRARPPPDESSRVVVDQGVVLAVLVVVVVVAVVVVVVVVVVVAVVVVIVVVVASAVVDADESQFSALAARSAQAAACGAIEDTHTFLRLMVFVVSGLFVA